MVIKSNQKVRRVFTVIDPERFVQPAFERGEWIAARNGAILHLYCCIGEQEIAADSPAARFETVRMIRWIERLIAETKQYKIVTEIEVEWNPNWRERIGEAAKSCGADLIVKTVSRHAGLARQFKKTADWTLLNTANCPVLLIDPSRPPQPGKVLAAVKLNPETEDYQILNKQVISMAHRISQALDAELHAVTAYKGDQIYFDRQKFADSCGLARNRVHSVEGAPHKGIPEAAKKLGADILVIGSANRNVRGSGMVLGDTAQRIIDAVDTDLVVIPDA